MRDNPIHFGTSGWRGVIADNFTFANVRLASAGIAQYLLSKSRHPVVVVGYDTRFFSEKFAETAADVLNAHGVKTLVATRPDPTPALAYEIIHRKLDGGVNITASHNPAQYNGLKFSGADGAPALPEVTRQIESNVAKLLGRKIPVNGSAPRASLREAADPRPSYLKAIRRKVDLKAIGGAKLKIAYDPLFGTGRGYLNDLLVDAGAEVITIHDSRDVLFSGVGPDPSEKNLAELARVVKNERCAVGLATDGDADRFGIVDADGTWINPNYILGLLADYLLADRKIPGGLGRSVATTHLMDAVAELRHGPVYQTPVGFKYIGELIKDDRIALGGEESAGLTIRKHIPEKDGILACLLVAEMVARRGLSLKQQLEALFKQTGPFYMTRLNLSLAGNVQQRLAEKLKQDVHKFDAQTVTKIDRTDGLKIIREDGSWVLMRPSGTEPVVRVYCEASSQGELDRLAEAARKFVLNP
ncbi:MAG TPA: phosphoglucomutase/phosphomannomutase family protein [Terriglobia bacterium]|nr:phosphoglucomutase/phosphomannomutase family protein [Terriglobia bacterium]